MVTKPALTGTCLVKKFAGSGRSPRLHYPGFPASCHNNNNNNNNPFQARYYQDNSISRHIGRWKPLPESVWIEI
jgi:hypothetical protein